MGVRQTHQESHGAKSSAGTLGKIKKNIEQPLDMRAKIGYNTRMKTLNEIIESIDCEYPRETFGWSLDLAMSAWSGIGRHGDIDLDYFLDRCGLDDEDMRQIVAKY